MKSGNLYVVATPIGNLEDITIRAINTLKNVDLILAEDTRHSIILLKHLNIQKPIESYHKYNEFEKSKEIIAKLNTGLNIALISDAGTPGISDPGNILIQDCISNNIDIIPIPGACAFIQSLICSGFNTLNFSFYGFLPVNKKERKIYFNKILTEQTNLIILYEAPHKLLKTLIDLELLLGDVNICISKEISKIHEKHLRTNIKTAINYYEANIPKGEFVIIVKKTEVSQKQSSIDEKEIQDIVIEKYNTLKKHSSLKEISKQLSQELNISKNELYTFLINNKQ